MGVGDRTRSCCGLAEAGRLSRAGELERQVRRMLADRRADVLASRFAAQWLRLHDLDKINPDVRFYPDFDEQLKASMRRETEMFFRHIVRDDRPVLDLFTADYTFVDERLARHYRIPGVVGAEIAPRDLPRRAAARAPRARQHPDAHLARRAHLAGAARQVGDGSAARHAAAGAAAERARRSTRPPTPPTDGCAPCASGWRSTARNPACMSCHRMIDPIGLALENFDVTGAWRIKDNGTPVDAASTLYDGTPLAGAADLRQALMKRSGVLVRTFTENLMTYALGRRLEAADMPMVRGRGAAGGQRRPPLLGVRAGHRADAGVPDEGGRPGHDDRGPGRRAIMDRVRTDPHGSTRHAVHHR